MHHDSKSCLIVFNMIKLHFMLINFKFKRGGSLLHNFQCNHKSFIVYCTNIFSSTFKKFIYHRVLSKLHFKRCQQSNVQKIFQRSRALQSAPKCSRVLSRVLQNALDLHLGCRSMFSH